VFDELVCPPYIDFNLFDKIQPLMKILRTEIYIEAPPSKVWETLLNFPPFSEWNPFIPTIKGIPSSGQKLSVSLKLPGTRAITLSPTLQEASPNRALIWKGKLGIKGLFDGEHRFLLESLGKGTRFIHEEAFSGLFPTLLPQSFFEKTRQGFSAMNLALKKRVEQS